MNTANIRKISKLLGFASLTILLTSGAPDGFLRPEPTTVISDASVANQMIDAAREGNNFANSIGINGNDVYNFMASTGSNTIAVYFGYSMAGYYDNQNKVMMLVPVNTQYKTVAFVDCLLYNSSNMSFDDQIPNANSSTQRISSGLVRNYINHFSENANKPEVRAILLQRSTLDNLIKNNSSSVTNDLILSIGKGENGETVVVAEAKTKGGKGDKKEGLNTSSLCPTNCDIY